MDNTVCLIPALVILCLTWFVLRACRVSVLGTVLGCLCLELITGAVSVVYHSRGSIFEIIPFGMLSLAAFVCISGSVAAFIVRACRSHEARRQNIFAAIAVVLLSVLWWRTGVPRAATLSEQRLQRELAGSECPKFIDELEALTDKLGHAPKDEEELVRLLQRGMPKISRGPIRYQSLGGKDFVLTFGYDFACYAFNSRQPERGWHVYHAAEDRAAMERR